MIVQVNATTTQIEGRVALWLSDQPCLPQEVAGESYNLAHVESIVRATGGELGVQLVAWLSPEPANPHDANAVMVWARGGKVGYLPRDVAAHWSQVLRGLHQQSRLPAACSAHVELPPEGGLETTYQLIVWLPPLPWQSSHALNAQDMILFADRARREPAARAEREQVRRERELAGHAQRVETLTAQHGADTAARILAKEIWLGASERIVTETFGEPTKVEEKVLKTKVKRIFNYAGECPKCDGVGVIPEFSHINEGECFSCGGTGRTKRFWLRVRFENGVVVGWDKN